MTIKLRWSTNLNLIWINSKIICCLKNFKHPLQLFKIVHLWSLCMVPTLEALIALLPQPRIISYFYHHVMTCSFFFFSTVSAAYSVFSTYEPMHHIFFSYSKRGSSKCIHKCYSLSSEFLLVDQFNKRYFNLFSDSFTT